MASQGNVVPVLGTQDRSQQRLEQVLSMECSWAIEITNSFLQKELVSLDKTMMMNELRLQTYISEASIPKLYQVYDKLAG